MIVDKSFDSIACGKNGTITPIFSTCVTLLLLSIIPEAIFMSSWARIGIIDGSLLAIFMTFEAYGPFVYRCIIKKRRVMYQAVRETSYDDCECGRRPLEFRTSFGKAYILFDCGTRGYMDRSGRIIKKTIGDMCTAVHEDSI